jgi:hypothetical protein
LEAVSAGKVALVRQDEGYHLPAQGLSVQLNVPFSDGVHEFTQFFPLVFYGQPGKMPPFAEMLLFSWREEGNVPPIRGRN